MSARGIYVIEGGKGIMTEEVFDMRAKELIPGMIISKDLICNDTLLLRKGSILDDNAIDRLNNVYLQDTIQVYIPEGILGERRKEIEKKKVEKAFQEVADKLKRIFSKRNTFDENGIEDLKEFASKVESQLKNSELALNTVLFKGDVVDLIYKHGVNVAVLSALLARWIGLADNSINMIIHAALLHDFGITKLAKELQEEPDIKMVDKNYKVKQHVTIAYDIMKNIKSIAKSITYGVLMHHERCDGSGYPLRIQGEKIHPYARIIAIADEYDVLNSDKKLLNEHGMFAALRIIKEKSFKSLDYKYSKIFLEHMCNYYIGEDVVLSDGTVARVLQMNMEDIENPLLLKDDEFIDLKKDKDLYVKELLLK